jgi:PPOX class probable F420-dependent enzyme
MPELAKAEIDAFLAQPLIARIATVRPDGRPHVVPIWFHWDGTSIYMETPPTFVKARNLAANPNVAITVDITEGGLRFKAVVLEGKVQILTDRTEVLNLVKTIYTKYLGPEGVESPTPKRMINSEHIIIKLSPSKILSWDDTRKGLAPVV